MGEGHQKSSNRSISRPEKNLILDDNAMERLHATRIKYKRHTTADKFRRPFIHLNATSN